MTPLHHWCHWQGRIGRTLLTALALYASLIKIIRSPKLTKPECLDFGYHIGESGFGTYISGSMRAKLCLEVWFQKQIVWIACME